MGHKRLQAAPTNRLAFNFKLQSLTSQITLPKQYSTRSIGSAASFSNGVATDPMTVFFLYF